MVLIPPGALLLGFADTLASLPSRLQSLASGKILPPSPSFSPELGQPKWPVMCCKNGCTEPHLGKGPSTTGLVVPRGTKRDGVTWRARYQAKVSPPPLPECACAPGGNQNYHENPNSPQPAGHPRSQPPSSQRCQIPNQLFSHTNRRSKESVPHLGLVPRPPGHSVPLGSPGD